MNTPPVKKIILRNIQSLPKAEIELGPPGTMATVIGESDTGKTALASRSLEKLYFNTIPTKELIRRGAKTASITAVYDTPDNMAIAWEWKGPSLDRGKARYVITRDNMEPIIVEGSNRPGHVPEVIQELTGVRPVKIGNLTLNFNVSRQLDGPFLGASVSPTERYRVLGALAGTLEVDEAVKEVGLEIHRSRRREKELAGDGGKSVGEIGKLEQKIREYDYLVPLKHSIDTVEIKLALIRGKIGRRDKLIALQIEICVKEELVKDAGDVAFVLGGLIEQTNHHLARVEANMAQHPKLTALHHAEKETHCRLLDANIILQKTESVPEVTTGLQLLINNLTKFTALTKLRQVITAECQKLTTAQQILDSTRDTETAQIALDRITSTNHTREQLMPLYVEIMATMDAVLRHTVTIDLTAGVGRVRESLGRVALNSDKVMQLAKLRLLIMGVKNRQSATQQVLDATSGMELLQNTLQEGILAANRMVRLKYLSGEVSKAAFEVTRLANAVATGEQDIQKAREEYRALLLEAGICENCPVVGEVMAAAG